MAAADAEPTGAPDPRRAVEREYPNIKGYAVLGHLGEGRYAEVYRAMKVQTGNFAGEVAVKVYSRGSTAEKMRRFDRETQMLNMVQDHPNVVALHACVAESMAIIMPRYDRDLHTYVDESGGLPEASAVQVLEHLLRAVEHIHSRRVLHRDIKPRNIAMLASNHEVVLLDFDIACTTADKVARSEPRGTPGYMAPEVIMGKIHHRAADLFSVGCVLYHLFACRHPFHTVPILDKAILRKTVLCDYTFGPHFDEVGSSCRDLISMLLDLRLKQRLTAHEALQHPWFAAQAAVHGPFTARAEGETPVPAVHNGSNTPLVQEAGENTAPRTAATALAAPLAHVSPVAPSAAATGAPAMLTMPTADANNAGDASLALRRWRQHIVNGH